MASTSLLPTNTTTCLLWLLLARALAVPSSIADIEPTQSPGGFGTQDAQHTAYSTSKHVLQLMHRYLGVVQMVQLIAVGSLIGAIGLWRKRRAAQHGESAEVGSNKVKRVDRSILHESPKNSFGRYSGIQNGISINCAVRNRVAKSLILWSRCQKHRPRPAQETLHDQIL